MKKNLLLLLVYLMGSLFHVMAQDVCQADTTIFYLPQNEFNTGRAWYFKPTQDQEQWAGGLDFYDMYDPCVAQNNTVVITEANIADGNYGTYLELTNLGDQAVDLSDYRLIGQRNDATYPALKITRMSHLDLSGTLEPGQSYLIMGFYKYKNSVKGVMDRADSLTHHNKQLAQMATIKYSINTISGQYPFLVGRGYDILGADWNYNFSLAKVIGDTAEVIVDVFDQLYAESGAATIAGHQRAARNFTVVRKHFKNGRTYGSTDFKISAGSEAAGASEWMLTPRFRGSTSHLPTTIGSHNTNSTYGISAIDGSDVTIDEAEAIIYLPWGTYKGDSIMTYIKANADMAWEYKANTVLEELVSNLAHTGDTITFYHCGADVTIKSYHIEVLEPIQHVAKAFTLRRKSDLSQMFYQTQGLAVDTIYGSRLTYDYPVDSLLAYIESVDTSLFKIIFKDADSPRPTLKSGDILRATAKNGATHDYYIALIPYDQDILSHDARLGAISWPDYPKDDIDPYLWTTGDTIPGFNKDGMSYIITLPFGTQQVPALQAVTYNPRASVNSIPATNLFGSTEDKTTTFVVTAEDDSTVVEYSVLFVVETENWEFAAEPFFSEYTGNNSFSSMIEICNPGNVALDLSDYVVVHGKYSKKTLPTVFAWDTDGFFDNGKVYRPGYTYDSLTMVSNLKYWFDPNGDSDVDSYVEPGGVFTIGATGAKGSSSYGYYDPNTGQWQDWAQNGIIEGPNVILHGYSNSKGWSWNKHAAGAYGLLGRIIYSSGKWTSQCNTFWLLKIVNDSIKEGTKGISEVADFEVIDIIGKAENGETFGWINPVTGRPLSLTPKGGYIRKPNIYSGNTISMGSFGYAGIETQGSYDSANPIFGDSAAFEWNIFENNAYNYDMGRHTLNPITIYKSTVSSSVYDVTLGISMTEEINGVAENTTGALLLSQIIKAHQDQTVQLSTADGALMFEFDVVQEGDILTVTSADGANQSAYTLHLGALSNDVSIASTAYEVSETSVALNHTDISLKEMVEHITVNEKATYYIVDNSDALVPFTKFNFRDSSYYNTQVSGNMFVKVVAQTGISKLYSIELPVSNSDAYLTSNLYQIDNQNKQINGVANGTNVKTLLENTIPCKGATANILNKWAQLKTFGLVLFNDVVEVVSADKSKTVYYGITLNSEVEPEKVLALSEKELKPNAIAYPNPTKGEVFFTTTFCNLVVYDVTGKPVKHVTQRNNKIDISGLDKGLYILSVTGDDEIPFTVKLTKQ